MCLIPLLLERNIFVSSLYGIRDQVQSHVERNFDCAHFGRSWLYRICWTTSGIWSLNHFVLFFMSFDVSFKYNLKEKINQGRKILLLYSLFQHSRFVFSLVDEPSFVVGDFLAGKNRDGWSRILPEPPSNIWRLVTEKQTMWGVNQDLINNKLVIYLGSVVSNGSIESRMWIVGICRTTFKVLRSTFSLGIQYSSHLDIIREYCWNIFKMAS